VIGSRKKWILGAALALIAAVAAAYIDLERRRHIEPPPSMMTTDSAEARLGPADLAKRYGDPDTFHTFCRKVHDKYLAMNSRYKALQHRRRQRSKQLDQYGKVVADESLVELVDFPRGIERRRMLEQKDELTGAVIPGETELQKNLAAGKAPFQYPFLPDSTWDDFGYRFGGVELLDGKPVVKVEFTPNPPFGRKTVGAIWADAESGQPLRFVGRWHKPTGLVHRFEMKAEYGPSENGFYQIRRIETDGAGGALFIVRRYVVAFDVDDYRTPESK
jgi:hypothetical protein